MSPTKMSLKVRPNSPLFPFAPFLPVLTSFLLYMQFIHMNSHVAGLHKTNTIQYKQESNGDNWC